MLGEDEIIIVSLRFEIDAIEVDVEAASRDLIERRLTADSGVLLVATLAFLAFGAIPCSSGSD